MSRLHEFIYRKKQEHKKMPNSKMLSEYAKNVSTGMILVCKVIMVKSVQDPRFPNFDPCYSFSDTLKTNPIDQSIFSNNKNQCISVFRVWQQLNYRIECVTIIDKPIHTT